MKTTDGYIKVNGEELSKSLSPNYELLKYDELWQEAIAHNNKLKLEEKRAERRKKREDNYLYLIDQAENDIETVKVECTKWVPAFLKRSYLIFFTKTVETKIQKLDDVSFYSKLVERNPEFWNETVLFYLMESKLNFKRFKESVYYLFDLFSDEYEEDRYRLFHRYYKLSNGISEFMNLKGDVFLNISDYNRLNRFIDTYHLKREL